MKKIVLLLLFAFTTSALWAQSKTTQALQDKFANSLSLYFYKNTMKMLNQTDNKDLDAMIKDIEKMKFLLIKKIDNNFGSTEYKTLKANYQKEDYESVMTSRYQGRNFDVLFKDGWSSPGTVILVNDSTNLYVLDIVGKVDINKVGELFSTLNKSTDIGRKIKEFTSHDRDKQKED